MYIKRRLLEHLFLILISGLSCIAGKAEHENHQRLKTRYYTLNITHERYNADCSDHQSSVLMVNNHLPGTPLYFVKGDRALITVCNNIFHNTPVHGGVGWDATIHFHGMLQKGSPSSDGVPYLTQRPIHPGECFLHDFTIENQEGTYFYHAHAGLKETSVFGAIVVYESHKAIPQSSPLHNSNHGNQRNTVKEGPFRYHDEHTLVISEWFHMDTGQFEEYFLSHQNVGLFDSDSFLINGQGIHNTSVDLDSYCKGYAIIPVESFKTYRLRIIGGLTFRTVGFALAGHRMKVIEVDGNYVKPYEVDYLELSSGQRFSVLIETDQSPGDYGIAIQRRLVDQKLQTSNGHAIMRYQPKAQPFKPWQYDPHTDQSSGTRLIVPALQQPTYPVNDVFRWYWDNLEPYYGVDRIALKSTQSDRTIKLRSKTNTTNGLTHWYINDFAFVEREPGEHVILYDVLNKTRAGPDPRNILDPATGFDSVLKTYPLKSMEVVDIVIQSSKGEEPCRAHPWHTHGHYHWEIAYGEGEYIEERDGQTRNVPTPLAKDLTIVYAGTTEVTRMDKKQETVGCGWSKIRIIADNPGIWAVHCHITPHMFMGMMAVLEESPELIKDNRLSTRHK
ncbi:MAG: Cupredoxin [Benjaminiella poitrasii]|nr:MAG: Cupredoxin [Benjaminiella poitrasii]